MVIERAIITGPTGAVGTALIDELVANGASVAAVCRPGSPRIANVPRHERVEIIECDLSDMPSLPEKIGWDRADAFFHFGWDGTFGASRQQWRRQDRNITYSMEAVEVAHELGCQVYVGAGSQSEFGHIEGVLSPTLSCSPDNAYGAAKLSACAMTRALCGELGIRHEWCRIVSLYGPGDAEHSLVSQVISKLLSGQAIECTRGDQVWDYIYSRDAARAFRLAAEKGKHGAIYVLGSGKPRLLKDYILAMRDAVDPSAQIAFGALPYYPNQVMHLEADISNLVEDTGFDLKYEFEDGLVEVIEDWRNRLSERNGR